MKTRLSRTNYPHVPCTHPDPLIKQLFDIIDDRKLSFRSICRVAKIDNQTLERIRYREHLPNYATLKKIAETIGYQLTLEKTHV